MPEPKNRLFMTKIERVSLVDRGDNPAAHVVIHKRIEEVAKALCPECKKPMDKDKCPHCEEYEMEHTEKAGLVKTLMKALGLGDDEVVIPAPKEETPKVEATDVNKAAVEALEKRVKEAEDKAAANEAEVQKLRKEQRTAEFITKAKALSNIPAKADEFGPILEKAFAALSEDEQKELDRVLSAANAGIAKHMTEVGSDSPAEGSAASKVEKLAEEAMKADPKLTKEGALAKVYKADPALRAEVEQEERDTRAKR